MVLQPASSFRLWFSYTSWLGNSGDAKPPTLFIAIFQTLFVFSNNFATNIVLQYKGGFLKGEPQARVFTLSCANFLIDIGVVDKGDEYRDELNRCIGKMNSEMLKKAISLHFHISEHVGNISSYSASIDDGMLLAFIFIVRKNQS